MIVLDRLSKSYGSAKVVDEVSLEVGPGELGVLVGRSGSGKSTVLMVAGGWLSADSGAALVPGSSDRAPPPWERTSYLSQRFGLLPELSIAENIVLPLNLAGVDDAGRVTELMDGLSLSDLAERRPWRRRWDSSSAPRWRGRSSPALLPCSRTSRPRIRTLVRRSSCGPRLRRRATAARHVSWRRTTSGRRSPTVVWRISDGRIGAS